MTEPVFKVKYECANCTDIFTKEYPERVTVKGYSRMLGGHATEERPAQTFWLSLFGYNRTTYVRCTNCRSRKVEIKERDVIE